MADADIVAIVNPLSGAGATSDVARSRVALLERRFSSAGRRGRVHLTERRGHARELARAALDAGAALVIAWGGDGTINEVAGTLAHSGIPLGIVPAGSGNGLANELGLSGDPERAVDAILDGQDRTIDGGVFDHRLFFNIAGTG